jgi:NIMA (never in mitosis gene a)-related kinase
MEFADGGDLQEKIDYCKRNGSNISEEKCWLYFTQAVVALKTLHDMNIVHRDIKSANFFLTSSGSVKLGDLNVSKVARKGSLLIT